jgi:isocitrate dehydrogenase
VTGVVVYIESSLPPAELADSLSEASAGTTFTLQVITNRGSTVFPAGDRSVSLVDHYRCRFMAKDRFAGVTNPEILSLLTRIGEAHIWMHVEKLQLFDDEDAFSRTQK